MKKRRREKGDTRAAVWPSTEPVSDVGFQRYQFSVLSYWIDLGSSSCSATCTRPLCRSDRRHWREASAGCASPNHSSSRNVHRSASNTREGRSGQAHSQDSPGYSSQHRQEGRRSARFSSSRGSCFGGLPVPFVSFPLNSAPAGGHSTYSSAQTSDVARFAAGASYTSSATRRSSRESCP